MNVSYTPEMDILSIDRDSDYDHSRVDDDFIIDFTPSGEVRGVEIQNITRLLGCRKDDLEDLSRARISTAEEEGGRKVSVHIYMGGWETIATHVSDAPPLTA